MRGQLQPSPLHQSSGAEGTTGSTGAHVAPSTSSQKAGQAEVFT